MSNTTLLKSGPVSVAVVAAGGVISSIAVDRPGRGTLELLLRTPWAGIRDGWSMPGSADEWHRVYPGGWHVLLPRPLGPVTVDGVDQPFHGEAAWRDWSVVRSAATSCALSVVLRTVPLEVARSVTLRRRAGATDLTVSTTVTNRGRLPVKFGWAEHPSFAGELAEGAVLRVGDLDVPLAARGEGLFDDLENESGRWRLSNSAWGIDLTMTWDAALFPRTYVWQERGSTTGFPWFGSVDTIAIEPSSQRHDHRRDELGILSIDAGEIVDSSVTLTIAAS